MSIRLLKQSSVFLEDLVFEMMLRRCGFSDVTPVLLVSERHVQHLRSEPALATFSSATVNIHFSQTTHTQLVRRIHWFSELKCSYEMIRVALTIQCS